LRQRAGFRRERLALAGDGLGCRRGALARGAARAARHALADGGDDIRQRALWIAQDGDLRRIILAQLPGIHVKVDQFNRGRHRIDVGGQRQGEEIATDREQHVVLIEHLAHIGREADHRAAEQWVRGGKGRGARHELGIDGRAQKLRKLDQFRVCAALRHGITRDDHGMLCFCEQGGRRFDRGPIPPKPRCHATRSGEIDVAVGPQDISGKRQEDGPGGRRQRGLRRPMHESGQIGQTMHLG
jgi:hypothetical protein